MGNEPKFNCPAPSCDKRFWNKEDVVQHIARAHRLRDKYLILDLENGRVWTANRLPAEVTEKAAEQIEATVVAA